MLIRFLCFFFLLIRPPPLSTLFPYTTLFRSIVLYVNGIALCVLELKRSTVSVSEGIRQNLDNQKKIFIQHFFTTIDRKSTRLNSSHRCISYAVFCLKKKKKKQKIQLEYK